MFRFILPLITIEFAAPIAKIKFINLALLPEICQLNSKFLLHELWSLIYAVPTSFRRRHFFIHGNYRSSTQLIIHKVANRKWATLCIDEYQKLRSESAGLEKTLGLHSGER